MSTRKFSLILIFSIILTLGLSISLGSLLAAWTAPVSAPPEGNIATPINTSDTGQSKQGGLILNTSDSANGLIVQFGNVGIGTDNPQAKLDVNGNIIAATPTANDHLATKEYVDASSGGDCASATDYTSARATKIDNLDTTISSRALDSEIGNATDAASISTTLFAGQQYIADNTGKVVWAGYTSAGGLTTTGTKGMNNSCNTAYSGSHACSYNDIIRLGNSYPYSANAWVIDGGITINDAGTMSQPSFAFAFSLFFSSFFFLFLLAFHRHTLSWYDHCNWRIPSFGGL